MIKTFSLRLLIQLLIVSGSSFYWQANAQLGGSGFDTLRLGFLHPPLEAKPKALWPWVNGNVSLSQITFEMEEAKRLGMGGFDIWDVGVLVNEGHKVPAGPPFLGRQSLNAIRHAVQEGDRLGLELGLITSSSWNAGGAWVKPEHGAMGMFVRDTIVQGPQQLSIALPFPARPSLYQSSRANIVQHDPVTGLPLFYRDIAVLAHPFQADSVITDNRKIIRIQSSAGEPKRIVWNVPPGRWRIARFVCAPTGQPLMVPSPNSNGLMLDHFSAAAQDANMKFVLDKLKEAIGPLNNRSLRYLYEDSYEVNSAVWTADLPEAFRHFAGYDVENWLPLLEGFRLSDAIQQNRFMFDFNKLLSELIIKNHYQRGTTLAAREGLGFYAEAGGPGKPIHNVPFEDLKALGSLTVPRGEFWVLGDDWKKLQVIKGIASAAHIYQQRYVEAEAFTSVWLWQEGPSALKPLADRAMCEGLNRFVYHTFPHTPPESGSPGWIYNFGTLINTTNGWWEKSAGFHHYLARCSYLLQQGNFVGDVAYYYGDEAPNFVPPKEVPKELGPGYDYDVINSDVILNRLTVRNGRFVLPDGQSYAVLVLPQDIRANPEVLRRLLSLVREGGTIIGPKPERAYGLGAARQQDSTVRALANQLWGKLDGKKRTQQVVGSGAVIWGEQVRTVLMRKGIGPDLDYNATAGDSLDYIHRSTPDAEIYFIRNVRKTTFGGVLRFRVAKGAAYLWQPETGQQQALQCAADGQGYQRIPFSLPGEGACFVVFVKTKSAGEAQVLLQNGDLQSLVYTQAGPALLQASTALDLSAQWTIDFQALSGTPIPQRKQALASWHLAEDTLVRYFSGKAVYNRALTLPASFSGKGRRYLLYPGEVREVGEVFVNGNRVGYHWHPSQHHDITSYLQPGENILTVEVVNSISNALVGDGRKPPVYRRYHSNVVKLPNAWMSPFAQAPLIPAGWLGPVLLREAVLIR